MTEQEFSKTAKELVYKHLAKYVEVTPTEEIRKYHYLKVEDIYIVWECFILGNNKALLATPFEDEKYFEVTYDKNKDRIYLDEYKKVFNQEIYKGE